MSAPMNERTYAAVVGQIIAHLRVRLGMKQQYLGDLAGMSASSISRFEQGTGIPDLYCARMIANAMGLPLALMIELVEDAGGRLEALAGEVALAEQAPDRLRAFAKIAVAAAIQAANDEAGRAGAAPPGGASK